MFNLADVTIGADPEIFVEKRGKAISAHVFQCGTKATPLQTLNGSVQVDGLALEINVPPSKNKISFIRNVGLVMQDLADIVATSDEEAYLVIKPTAHFGEDYIASLPEEVQQLGCNPDWNAYTMQENPTPNGNVPFRTAGGHIHIGWGVFPNHESLQHIGECAEIAKQLDYMIGLPSLDYDKDDQRRTLYGRAGAFRPKPYGMEYRTLSPVWMTTTKLTGMVYDRTIKALRLLNEGTVLDELFDGFAQEAIDNNDYAWAAKGPGALEILRHIK